MVPSPEGRSENSPAFPTPGGAYRRKNRVPWGRLNSLRGSVRFNRAYGTRQKTGNLTRQWNWRAIVSGPYGTVLTRNVEMVFEGYSAAEVWSWIIFQPSGNLRKTSVKRPCGVFPSDNVNCHAPRTKAAPGPSFSTRRSEKSNFPISCPGLA